MLNKLVVKTPLSLLRSRYQRLQNQPEKEPNISIAFSPTRRQCSLNSNDSGNISRFLSVNPYGRLQKKGDDTQPLLSEFDGSLSEYPDTCKLINVNNEVGTDNNIDTKINSVGENKKVDQLSKIKSQVKFVGNWIKKNPWYTAAIIGIAVVAALSITGFALGGGALIPAMALAVLLCTLPASVVTTGFGLLLKTWYERHVLEDYLKKNNIPKEDIKWGYRFRNYNYFGGPVYKKQSVLNALLTIKKLRELEPWPQDKSIAWKNREDFESAWKVIKSQKKFSGSPQAKEFVETCRAFAKEICDEKGQPILSNNDAIHIFGLIWPD